MKILPIQNFSTISPQQTRANNNHTKFASNQLSSDMVVLQNKPKKKSISFGNLNETAITLAKQLPLEDRIASLFDVFKRGDIITVGKNLKETQRALKNSLDSLDHVIKRIFFIEDDNIQGSLAFYKNATGDKEILNINNFDLYLSNSTGQEALKPNNSFYVTTDDILYIGDMGIKIKDEPKTNLSFQRHIFSKVFDFTKDSQDIIKRQNTKELKSLVLDTQEKNKPLTFADIGGQDKAIEELKKGVLYPIKYPEAFENIKVNHGIILTGPPGTGKTLIAESLANESNAFFLKLNGSELKSKWVGESEENLRTLFEGAIENQPSIIVFDEFDSVAKKRDKVDNYSAEFVNQFLSIMSDIEKQEDDVYILATTNKIEMLDDAIMRSGRFGKHIQIGLPDLQGTRQILDIHTAKKPLDESIDKEKLSKKLFEIHATGADIARLSSDAYNNAFERVGIFDKMSNGTFVKSDIDNLKITKEDFEQAINNFVKEGQIKERKKIGYN